MFCLSTWYLDAIDDQGSLFIAYVELDVRRVRVHCTHIRSCSRDAPSRHTPRVVLIAMLGGVLNMIAFGVDWPESSRRFSRLAD